jgi:hypothetical protein
VVESEHIFRSPSLREWWIQVTGPLNSTTISDARRRDLASSAPLDRVPTIRPVTTSTWALLTVADLLLWVGVALLLDAWLDRRRQRPSLSERLMPYQDPSVADGAEAWLRLGT